MTLAPESASWWRRNSPLYAVLTGTWTAPSFSAAKNEITCSGPFSSSVATRSPRPTPQVGERRGRAGRPPASISRGRVRVALEVEVRAVGVGREATGERREHRRAPACRGIATGPDTTVRVPAVRWPGSDRCRTLLDGDADLLAVRQLEVVTVGVGDDRPVPDRRPGVVRTRDAPALLRAPARTGSSTSSRLAQPIPRWAYPPRRWVTSVSMSTMTNGRVRSLSHTTDDARCPPSGRRCTTCIPAKRP